MGFEHEACHRYGGSGGKSGVSWFWPGIVLAVSMGISTGAPEQPKANDGVEYAAQHGFEIFVGIQNILRVGIEFFSYPSVQISKARGLFRFLVIAFVQNCVAGRFDHGSGLAYYCSRVLLNVFENLRQWISDVVQIVLVGQSLDGLE